MTDLSFVEAAILVGFVLQFAVFIALAWAAIATAVSTRLTARATKELAAAMGSVRTQLVPSSLAIKAIEDHRTAGRQVLFCQELPDGAFVLVTR